MTDFFTRLAERTLGLATLVQPLIAPLYAASQHQVENDLVEETENLHAPRVESITREPHPGDDEGFATRDDRASHTRLSMVDDRVPVPAPRVPARGTPTMDEAASHGHPSMVDDRVSYKHPSMMDDRVPARGTLGMGMGIGMETDEVRSSITITATQFNTPLRPARPATDMPTLDEQSQVRRQEMLRLIQEPVNDQLSATMSDVPSFSPTFQKILQREEEERQSHRRSQIGMPRKSAVVPTTDEPTTEASSPTPNIHVTIGRVEVRATLPPATSAPRSQSPRPASTVMSLDEYLQQRSKGGR